MKRSWRLLFSCVLVALAILLTACRGDWYYELPNDYALDRVNAHSIQLSKKNPELQSYHCVLENYYVYAVCVADKYILTSGIPTKEEFATDAELVQTDRTYYAVNYETSEIFGPFAQEDELRTQLSDILANSEPEWIYTKDIQK